MPKKIAAGLYILLTAMIVANVLLVKQNLQMRGDIEAARPDRLEVGDEVPPFVALGLNGETKRVSIYFVI